MDINSKHDKPLYWDSEKQKLYWVEWRETDNDDIPIRHYLEFLVRDENKVAYPKPIIKIVEKEE
jgi:hypothetical protein